MVVKPGQSPVGPSPAGESSRGKQKISDDNGVDKPTRVPGTRVQGPSRDYRYLNIPFAYKEDEVASATQADAQLSNGNPKSLKEARDSTESPRQSAVQTESTDL